MYSFNEVNNPYFPAQGYGFRNETNSLYAPVFTYVHIQDDENRKRLTQDMEVVRNFIFEKPSYSQDALADILSEKTAVQKTSLFQTLFLIKYREILKSRHIREINSKMTEMSGKLGLLKICPPMDGGRQAGNLEKIMCDLEGDKRQEETSCWRDILELKTKLLEVAKEYRATARRGELFKVNQENDRYKE